MSHVTMFSQICALLAPEYVYGRGDSQMKRAHAIMWHSCMGAHARLPEMRPAIHLHITPLSLPQQAAISSHFG